MIETREHLIASVEHLLAQATAHGIVITDPATGEVSNPEVLDVVDPCRCHITHTPCLS